MRDYCSGFPERWEGIEIGQTCCKQHDNQVGEAGTYNPATPHINFYNCLKDRGISFWSRVMITAGGVIFTVLKSPWLYYTKYRYRHSGHWNGIIK